MQNLHHPCHHNTADFRELEAGRNRQRTVHCEGCEEHRFGAVRRLQFEGMAESLCSGEHTILARS